MSIGSTIRTAREVRGLTQADLAGVVGVDERQIRRYEADEVKDLKLARAQRIADALGVPLDELFVPAHAGDATPAAQIGRHEPANGSQNTQPDPTLASVSGAGPTTGG